VVNTEVSVGDRVLDRARKLVALDRALIEIGEPGVLERAPDELASLESRLFGPPVGSLKSATSSEAVDTGKGGDARPATDAGPAEPGAGPALRLVLGALQDGSAVDPAQRLALRGQLRLIRGGRQAG
jgi:hypothetical protein